jgi:tetratricopeptide (TPR) repeat protein
MGVGVNTGRRLQWSRPAVAATSILSIWVGTQPFGVVFAQSDYNDFLLLRENFAICTDQSQPLTKRKPSCEMVVAKGGLGKSEIAKIYLSLAQACQESGDDQGALQNFNDAIKDNPKYEQSWLGRAYFYASKSDFSHALEDYDQALKINPKDPVVYDNRGITMHAMGERDKAIADFSRAIALDPQDRIAYSNRATLYLGSGEMNLAIADLSEVLRANPADGMAAYNRGTAYERSGQLDKALEDYRSAVRLQPSYAPASAALGRLLKDKDPQEAIAELSAAIRLDPKSPALRSRAILYLALARFDDALQDFDRVIATDGSDSLAFLDRGVAQEKLGDLQAAIGDYTRSIELAPVAPAYINRGNAYLRSKQLEKALADFTAAVALEPANLAALMGRADTSYARKSMSETLVDYSQVIDLDPKNVVAYFRRGNVHFDLREYAAAFSDYSDSLKLDPNQPVVLYNRSLAAARMGRLKEANDDRQRAIALDASVATGEEITSRGK